jgi:hypothetical protein
MINKVLKTFIFSFLAAPILVSAVELEDVKNSVIPNQFANGEVSDATKVNENFEYLRAKIESLVILLEQQKTLSTDTSRFEGAYEIIALDTGVFGSCPDDQEPPGFYGGSTVAKAVGTATSSGGTLSLSLVGWKSSSAAEFLTEPESSSSTASVSPETGRITGNITGQMSSDGNTFSISYGEASIISCGGSLGYAGLLIGTRIP